MTSIHVVKKWRILSLSFKSASELNKTNNENLVWPLWYQSGKSTKGRFKTGSNSVCVWGGVGEEVQHNKFESHKMAVKLDGRNCTRSKRCHTLGSLTLHWSDTLVGLIAVFSYSVCFTSVCLHVKAHFVMGGGGGNRCSVSAEQTQYWCFGIPAELEKERKFLYYFIELTVWRLKLTRTLYVEKWKAVDNKKWAF